MTISHFLLFSLFMQIYFCICVKAVENRAERISTVHACLKDAQDIPNNRLNGRTLAGIIGFGWDDLRSIRTKPIFFESFDECRAEPTGHYLLPDNIVAVPILQTKIDEMANFYESFEYFKEEVSNVFSASASAGFSWLSASASFSKTNQKTKENFAKYKSSLLQTKLNYEAFSLSQDSVGSLSAGFRSRIDEIADAVSRNLTYRARYLSEMIIKDYGTHYISAADIGATVSQNTFIESKSNFDGATSLQGVQFAASIGLTKLFNLSASVSNTRTVATQDIKYIQDFSRTSYFEATGGPDINLITVGKANFTIDNIVPYSFDGDWLYQIISKQNFPELSYDTLFNMQILLKNSTETYYERNTIQGCMDMNSPNFDFQANYDNGSCVSNNDSYQFGGFYQTCSAISGPDWRCNGIRQSNEFVGGMKCDGNFFESVKLFDTIYEFETRKENHPRKKCTGIWPFEKCRNVDFIIDFIDKVKIEAFWCRKKANVVIPPEYGAMFGGVFEKSEPNLITGKPGCPGTFKPYRMGRSTSICLSYQYEQDHKFSIPFAGFFSCQSGMVYQPSDGIRSNNGGGFRNNSGQLGNDGFRSSGGGGFRDTIGQTGGIISGNSGFRGNTSQSTGTRSELGGFRRPSSNGGFRNNNNVATSEVKTSRPNNGFISTDTSLPLRQCPEGYSQQLLPIEMTCHVFYCVKKHSIKNIFSHPKLLRPPYTLPEIAANNFTESTFHVTYDGIEIMATPLNKISITNSIPSENYINGLNGKETNDPKFQNLIIDAFIEQVEAKVDILSNNLTATPTEMAQKLKNDNLHMIIKF